MLGNVHFPLWYTGSSVFIRRSMAGKRPFPPVIYWQTKIPLHSNGWETSISPCDILAWWKMWSCPKLGNVHFPLWYTGCTQPPTHWLAGKRPFPPVIYWLFHYQPWKYSWETSISPCDILETTPVVTQQVLGNVHFPLWYTGQLFPGWLCAAGKRPFPPVIYWR